MPQRQQSLRPGRLSLRPGRKSPRPGRLSLRPGRKSPRPGRLSFSGGDRCAPCTDPSDEGYGTDGHDRYTHAGTNAFFTVHDFMDIRCATTPAVVLAMSTDMDNSGRTNDERRTAFLRDAMNRGENIAPPILQLVVCAEVDSSKRPLLEVRIHDGRHRCVACQEMGCDKVTILVNLPREIKDTLLVATGAKAAGAKVAGAKVAGAKVAKGAMVSTHHFTVLSEKAASRGKKICADLIIKIVGTSSISATLALAKSKCDDPKATAAKAGTLALQEKARQKEAAEKQRLASVKANEDAEQRALDKRINKAVKKLVREQKAVKARRKKDADNAEKKRKAEAEKAEKVKKAAKKVQQAQLALMNADRKKHGLPPWTSLPFSHLISDSKSDSDSDSDDVDLLHNPNIRMETRVT